MAAKLSRSCQLLNVYLPAADFALGTRMMEELMERVATTGEDWVMFGDFNREQLQHPISHCTWQRALPVLVILLTRRPALVGTRRAIWSADALTMASPLD